MRTAASRARNSTRSAMSALLMLLTLAGVSRAVRPKGAAGLEQGAQLMTLITLSHSKHFHLDVKIYSCNRFSLYFDAYRARVGAVLAL